MSKHKKNLYILPYIFLFSCMLLEASTNSFLHFLGGKTPTYEYMIIFYWSLFLPNSLPFIVLFAIGLLRDLILLSPIGFSAISFVLLKFLLEKQKLTENHFIMIWVAFVTNIAFVMLIQFILVNLNFNYSRNFFNITTMFVGKWIVTSLLYPIAHLLFFFCRYPLIKNQNVS